jgi:hypothetical protein
MTTIDEKEILEIEKLKQDIKLEMKRIDLEMRRTNYEGWKLSFYGIAVGAGATFAFIKTIQLLG